MQIHGVDPRDTRWERYAPVYRVHFWDDRGVSDEYEITDADVPEVLAWAEVEGRQTNRTYVLWLRHEDRDDDTGLIRLAGWEQPSGQIPGADLRPAYATDRPALWVRSQAPMGRGLRAAWIDIQSLYEFVRTTRSTTNPAVASNSLISGSRW